MLNNRSIDPVIRALFTIVASDEAEDKKPYKQRVEEVNELMRIIPALEQFEQSKVALYQTLSPAIQSQINYSQVNYLEHEDEKGETLLTRAISKGYIDIVKSLLDNKADPNRDTSRGNSPLCIASDNGNIEIIKLLIENKVNLQRATGLEGTALTRAIKVGNRKVSKLLLEAKANPNQGDLEGEDLPLCIASAKGDIKMIKLLIENQANLQLAIGRKGTTLMRAVNAGNREVSKLLLEAKANPNQGNSKGENLPLCIASCGGDIEMARLLLAYGADPNLPESQGGTPLACAIDKEHVETVQLLLDHHADPNNYAFMDSQITPLSLSLKKHPFSKIPWDMTLLLIDAKADTEMKLTGELLSQKPLDFAMFKGYLNLVGLLLTEGALIEDHHTFEGWVDICQRVDTHARRHKALFDLYKGALHEKKSEFSKAISCYNQLAEEGYGAAFKPLGRLYEQKGHFSKATESFVITLNRGNILSLIDLIRLAQKISDNLHFLKEEKTPLAHAMLVDNQMLDKRDEDLSAYWFATQSIYAFLIKKGFCTRLTFQQLNFLIHDALGNPFFKETKDHADNTHFDYIVQGIAHRIVESAKTVTEKEEAERIFSFAHRLFTHRKERAHGLSLAKQAPADIIMDYVDDSTAKEEVSEAIRPLFRK